VRSWSFSIFQQQRHETVETTVGTVYIQPNILLCQINIQCLNVLQFEKEHKHDDDDDDYNHDDHNHDDYNHDDDDYDEEEEDE